MLAHCNNSPSIDISPSSDTVSWFRANQSLLSLLNVACLARSITYQFYNLWLIWPDRDSNPRSTALEASTLTITTPMRFLLFENRFKLVRFLFSFVLIVCFVFWFVLILCISLFTKYAGLLWIMHSCGVTYWRFCKSHLLGDIFW